MADVSSSNYWDAISALAWPGVLAGIAWYYKAELARLIETFRSKVHQSYELKFGSVELKGVNIQSEIDLRCNSFESAPATEAEKKFRDSIYNATQSFMLAHRIKPSSRPGQQFDVSIFIVGTKSTKLNNRHFGHIKSVEYYLGRSFGGSEFGSKFTVSNPEGGFAITTSAYGPTLCIAKIRFRDIDDEAMTYRFLDFEMKGAYGN